MFFGFLKNPTVCWLIFQPFLGSFWHNYYSTVDIEERLGEGLGYDRLDFSRPQTDLRPQYQSTNTLKSLGWVGTIYSEILFHAKPIIYLCWKSSQRNWVFATNLTFLIPISFQPDGVTWTIWSKRMHSFKYRTTDIGLQRIIISEFVEWTRFPLLRYVIQINKMKASKIKRNDDLSSF